ncbi:hypothetical protein, partial [Leptospira bandrabouensis]|uniref:hypothetical protein n=1 Tax=Leptospira bandrabouensis TaxID=2484903 RepID=UPI001EE96AA2
PIFFDRGDRKRVLRVRPKEIHDHGRSVFISHSHLIDLHRAFDRFPFLLQARRFEGISDRKQKLFLDQRSGVVFYVFGFLSFIQQIRRFVLHSLCGAFDSDDFHLRGRFSFFGKSEFISLPFDSFRVCRDSAF